MWGGKIFENNIGQWPVAGSTTWIRFPYRGIAPDSASGPQLLAFSKPSPKDLQNGSSKYPTPGATFASNDKGLRPFFMARRASYLYPPPPRQEPFLARKASY